MKMRSIFYALSPQLNTTLSSIKNLTSELCISPISRKKEIELHWVAYTETIYFALKFKKPTISIKEITLYLSETPPRKKQNLLKEISTLKDALQFIDYELSGTSIPVKVETLAEINALLAPSLRFNIDNFSEDISAILNYTQVKPESPFVQASIIFIMLYIQDQEKNFIFPYLIMLVFLYKSGYTFRGLLSFSKYLYENTEKIEKILDLYFKTQNLTPWIEFFALGIKNNLERVQNNTSVNKYVSPYFELTDRQKRILQFLDDPESKISNKKVQENFNVSQITASRDLARLTALNLLIPVGKGRSTYYKKM